MTFFSSMQLPYQISKLQGRKGKLEFLIVNKINLKGKYQKYFEVNRLYGVLRYKALIYYISNLQKHHEPDNRNKIQLNTLCAVTTTIENVHRDRIL